MAPVVNISVYSRLRRVIRRWNTRQCRSVQSIIGATEKRKSWGFVGFSVISIFYGVLEFILIGFAPVSKETTSLPRRTRLSHFDTAVRTRQ